jgi:hypothetical protein
LSQKAKSTDKSPADPISAGDFLVYPVEKPVESVENLPAENWKILPYFSGYVNGNSVE